jgi:hypothetical protein
MPREMRSDQDWLSVSVGGCKMDVVVIVDSWMCERISSMRE